MHIEGKRNAVLAWLAFGLVTMALIAVSPERTRAQTTELTEPQQTRIINLGANMSNRMEATIERLRLINTRLESRFNKTPDLSDEAITVFLQHQMAALDALEAAAQTMDTIDADMYAVVTAEDPKKQWPAVRDSFVQTKTQITLAYQALLKALQTLQNPESVSPIIEETVAATSTSTSTDSATVTTGDTSTTSTTTSTTE